MNEIAAGLPAPAPEPGAALPLAGWVREGLRAGVFRRPRVEGFAPRPRQMLLLVLLVAIVEVGLARLEVPGDATFNLRGYLGSWWSVGASALLVWWLLWGRQPTPGRPSGVGAWVALWLVAALVPGAVADGLNILDGWDLLPSALDDSDVFAWGTFIALWAWALAIAVQLGRHFGLDRRRLLALTAGLCLIFGVSSWQFPDRPWTADDDPEDDAPHLSLSQDTFETQQMLWEQQVKAMPPRRPGMVNVYGLVFAPDGSEDVFLRESTLVADLLAKRFDAEGRVLQLANNPATAGSVLWATPVNLERAVEAIAERMDREHDVLVLYLTSHGADNFELAAANPPLDVDSVSPSELRRALDDAGIRNRVIAISACYSGGWIPPLQSDTTLVMTAADADHTSYGCGRLSELTFFGRAMFDEQLRHTHSFERAFKAAVPVIRQREVEAHKPDGFSNPQISEGAGIRPVLRALEQRLDANGPHT